MITLNRKSWHYWLATRVADYCEGEDFCAYTRSVLVGALLVGIATIVFGGLGIVTGIGAVIWAGRLLSLITSTWVTSHTFAQTSMAMTLIVIGVTLAILIQARFKFWRENRRIKAYQEAWHIGAEVKPREPSFIALAWESFKGKFCTRVDFK